MVPFKPESVRVTLRKISSMFVLEKIEINKFSTLLSLDMCENRETAIKNNFWSDKIVESTVVNQVCNFFEWKVT